MNTSAGKDKKKIGRIQTFGQLFQLLPASHNFQNDLDGVTALFHEPFGSTGGATDADGMDAFEPGAVDLFGTLDEVGVGIDTLALVEEYLAVGALATTDEEDEVVAGGKL